jgi:hypothetical protein
MWTYRVTVTGSVPRIVGDRIRSRFGEVTIRAETDRTVLTGLIIDQPAIRALTGLLWDLGCEILLLVATLDGRTTGREPR